MDQARLERLERLHKLRASGALDDDEFQSEKRKLLADDFRRGPARSGRLVYWLIGLAVLIGAVSLGFWVTRTEQTLTSETPSSQKFVRALAPAPAVPAPIRARSTADRLADAFNAATGHRSGFSQLEGGEVVTTQPLQIIELPFGPALLTKREIKDGCHACMGAIGVFYLKEQADSTVVTGRWPKAVEGWGWGAAPTWHLTDQFAAYPAVFASGGFMGQGVVEESATLTELRPDGPVTSDVIGTGFSDEGAIVDDGRRACVVTGRISNVRKDKSFDVIVSGSVKSIDHYVKRGRKFVAASKLDWGVPCDNDPFASGMI